MAIEGGTFWQELWNSLLGNEPGNWIVKLAALIVATFLFWMLKPLYQWAWPKLKLIYRSVQDIERARIAVSPESKGIWLAKSIPPEPPANYSDNIRRSIPIVVVANLKGGVGKTTTAANLIAHFANKKGKKVLAIDLDFQGSLSATALSEGNREALADEQAGGNISRAAHLINDKDGEWLCHCTMNVELVPKAQLLPAYYTLSNMENRVMVEWLIGKRRDDIRYHLADALHSSVVQRAFDMVIIDAPPRLTTACVQGLCACTHVLIPTILDELSAQAVGAFADQLCVNQEIWPHLRVLGVVGTMTENNAGKEGATPETALKTYEADAIVAVKDALKEALLTARPPLRDAKVFSEKCFIPQKAELSKAAGDRIAYSAVGNTGALVEIREAFDRLGDAIEHRLKIGSNM